ncbi:MAG: hypothetical protein KIT84_18330 [Labilithrix sp.]|nr:hypothetical protein [Labilithrix sp.]MCW5812991.1 hypothetical protein [Labilithrix sp.]
MIHSAASYIEKAYEPATRKRIYDRISPRVRELFAFVNKFEWYPVDDAAEIFRAIAAHHRESDGKIAAALEGVGRQIAETASTTSLKLLFRLMTPALFAKKASDLWERNSRCGELAVPSFEAANRKMSMKLTDVEGFDFIGLVASGFVLYALEAVGCKNPRASFVFDEGSPAPSALAYELTWE